MVGPGPFPAPPPGPQPTVTDLLWCTAALISLAAEEARETGLGEQGGLVWALEQTRRGLVDPDGAWDDDVAPGRVARPRRYRLRAFYDGGSGHLLWAADATARERWDYPVDHFDLPVPLSLARRVQDLIDRYDLDHPDMGRHHRPFSDEEREAFHREHLAPCRSWAERWAGLRDRGRGLFLAPPAATRLLAPPAATRLLAPPAATRLLARPRTARGGPTTGSTPACRRAGSSRSRSPCSRRTGRPTSSCRGSRWTRRSPPRSSRRSRGTCSAGSSRASPSTPSRPSPSRAGRAAGVFSWTPPDGLHVTQRQVYFARAGAGFTAIATSPGVHAARFAALFDEVLGTLVLDVPPTVPEPAAVPSRPRRPCPAPGDGWPSGAPWTPRSTAC